MCSSSKQVAGGTNLAAFQPSCATRPRAESHHTAAAFWGREPLRGENLYGGENLYREIACRETAWSSQKESFYSQPRHGPTHLHTHKCSQSP